MNKKTIITLLLLIAVLSLGIISIYTTFAYNEEVSLLDESDSNYNLIYYLKDLSNKNISLNKNEEKYIDVVLTNPYDGTLKYGMYYKIINSKENLPNIKIEILPDSLDELEGVIKTKETKIVSLKIKNESNDNIDLVVGALVGFVQGKIEDLQKDGEILIK